MTIREDSITLTVDELKAMGDELGGSGVQGALNFLQGHLRNVANSERAAGAKTLKDKVSEQHGGQGCD